MAVESTYYWQRATAAVERRRLELARRDLSDDNDPIWQQLEHLNWLEQYAAAGLHMAEEAEIF